MGPSCGRGSQMSGHSTCLPPNSAPLDVLSDDVVHRLIWRSTVECADARDEVAQQLLEYDAIAELALGVLGKR
jgi:hypothetical protein